MPELVPGPRLIGDGVFYVQLAGERDPVGRVMFFLYWPEGTSICTEVRTADERACADRWRAEGRTVLYWPSGDPVPGLTGGSGPAPG